MPIITTRPCTICGQTSEVEMTDAEVTAYQRERFIQEALPHWPKEQRELLISGTHPACWTLVFGDDEDEE